MGKFCEYDGETNTFSEKLREQWVEAFRRGLAGDDLYAAKDRHTQAERGTGRTARVIARAIEAARAGKRPVIVTLTSGLVMSLRPRVAAMSKAAGLERGSIRVERLGADLTGLRDIFLDDLAEKKILEMWIDGRLR